MNETAQKSSSELELEVFQKNPLSILRSGYLKIKTKAGKMLPLFLKKNQLKILDAVNSQRIKGIPVRLAILKYRQGGVSTELEGMIYANTSLRANQNALILSSDDDGSNHLFEMSKLFHEKMELEHPHLTPQLKRSNEKKLEFHHKHSLILIDTAQNKRAGRSYTFQHVHISEAAFFPSFAKTMLALSQAVPEEKETYMFIETTANGEDNDFCKWWRKIEEAFGQGDSTWIPLFLSWKDEEDYQRAFITDSEQQHFIKLLSTEDRALMAKHNLTLEQMNWRRRTIIDKCNGDVQLFRQEYPLTAEEAFLTTSKRIFGVEHTAPQEKNIVESPTRGELEWINNRPTLIISQDGDLRIYEGPKKGHRYVMAIDACEGLKEGDWGVIQILDRTTWSQAAVYRSQTPPDLLGKKAFALGAWYNWALAAPEVNGPGLVTTLALRDQGYPNIVHRTSLNVDAGEIKETDELGWHTNAKTKPLLMSDLESALREILIVLKDKQTLNEIKHFIRKDVSEAGFVAYGAAPGHHDDCVITIALAIHFAKTLPEGQRAFVPESEVRSSRSTGY